MSSADFPGSRNELQRDSGRSSPQENWMKEMWVSVAQSKQVMKKHDFTNSESEGKQSIDVPSYIIEKANPIWEDFFIARFLETAPHIAKVHMILYKIWAFGDKAQKLDVYEVDSTTMRIRITSAKIR